MYIDSWLHFANGVEELDLSFKGLCFEETKVYRVPEFVYSYSLPKKLSFSGCILEVTGKAVQWNQLVQWKRLRGFNVSMKQILLGSPRLEVLNLLFVETDGSLNLNIQSSSLKVLSICKDVGGCEGRPSLDTELRIWTPNLKSLRIEGMPYGKCLLQNVSSLTHATLWFDEKYDWDDVFGIDESDNLCPTDYLVETLSQILPAIQHVEGFTLSEWSIKVLLNMNCESLLSTFPYVKFLRLNGKFEELVCILGLLEIFPKLEMLVVKEVEEFYAESKLEFKWNPNMHFLDELRTIEVTWNQSDFSIFPLIESLLKYARKLERMVFRVKEIKPPLTAAPPNSVSLASQKLYKMPRSSPNTDVTKL